MKHKRLLYLMLLGFSVLSAGCKSASGSGDPDVEDVLDKLKDGEQLVVKDLTFEEDLNLYEVNQAFESVTTMRGYIDAPILFLNCTFKGKVNASGKDGKMFAFTTFNKSICFMDCQFENEVNFRSANIRGHATFKGSVFHADANFQGAEFAYSSNYFERVQFLGKAEFQRAEFEGFVSFAESEFSSILSFQYATFRKDVNLGGCKFMEYLDLSKVVAFGKVHFQYSEGKKADFTGARFMGPFDLINSKLYGPFRFNGAVFHDRCRFNQSYIQQELDLSGARFLYGPPETDKMEKAEGATIKTDEETYIVPLEILNFKN